MHSFNDHVGVSGNDIADGLAKNGATHDEVELQLPVEIKDEHPLIDSYIADQWQAQYNSSTSGAAYRMLEPTVSSKMKFADKNRKKKH